MRGTTLTQYRKAAGYTQIQLAEVLGVARRSIQGWEAGWVPRGKVAQVAKLLGVPDDALEDPPAAWGPGAARVAELEERLAAVTSERDDLVLRVRDLEEQVAALGKRPRAKQRSVKRRK